MKKRIAVVVLLLSCQLILGQAKLGKWHNTTEDTKSPGGVTFLFSGDGKLLITEEYEILKTHEICANVYGYFLEKSGTSRYEVNFNGARISNRFIFSTQYDAEKWTETWCKVPTAVGRP